MSNYHSPLGRLLPTSMDLESVKRRGYHEDGIVVIDMRNDELDWMEREVIERWAQRRYPKRGRQ